MADGGFLAKGVDAKLATYADARKNAPPRTNIELEARLRLSSEEIAAIVKELEAGKSRVAGEVSVQIGNVKRRASRNNYIQLARWVIQHRPLGVKNPKSVRTWVEKEVLGDTIQVSTVRVWRLSTSRERVVEPFTPGPIDALARVKARLSYTTEKFPGWRVDVTLHWQVEGIQGSGRVEEIYKRRIAELLEAGSRKELVGAFVGKLLEPKSIFQGSVELEWVGEANPTRRDLEAVDAVLQLGVQSDSAGDTDFAVAVEGLARALFPSAGHALQRARRGLKGLLPQVRALTWAAYTEFNGGRPLSGWLVGAKTEGFHCLVICGERVEILYEAHKRVVERPPCAARRDRRRTVLEGEIILKPDGYDVYVFDALFVEGSSLLRSPPETRVLRIVDGVAAVRHACGRAADAPSWLHAKVPEVVPAFAGVGPSAAVEAAIRRQLDETRFPADGLVFTRPGTALFTQTESFKWKPPEQITIDFYLLEVPPCHRSDEFDPARVCVIDGGRARRLDPSFEGAVYALFVTANLRIYQARDFADSSVYPLLPPSIRAARAAALKSGDQLFKPFPVLFAPPNQPQAHVFAVPAGAPGGAGEYSGEICELLPEFFDEGSGAAVAHWTPEHALLTTCWKLVRVRADRRPLIKEGVFGNFVTTAEENLYSRLTPLPAPVLWGNLPKEEAYFLSVKEPRYAAPTAFASFVKARLFARLAGGRHHVELAAGRGGDVNRIWRNNPDRALFVDVSPAALLLLLQRVQSFNSREKTQFSSGFRPASIRIAVALADLSLDPANVTRVVHGQLQFPLADSVSIQFALHYMCGSAANFANFAYSCDQLTASGALMIATFPDGAEIIRLIASAGKGRRWEHAEGGRPKYSLELLGRGPLKLTAFGQRVAVRLPFRPEPLEEFLVNFDAVSAVMSRVGFVVECTKLFNEYLPAFGRENRDMFSQMTPGDSDYMGRVYRAVVWRKQ